MSAEQNKSIVYRWVEEAWNHGNFSSAQSLYPSTYTLHDSSTPEPVVGPHALAAFIGVFRSGIPDLHMTVEQMVAEGEVVSWRFKVEGTQTGELFGTPPSGNRVVVTGTVTSRFENGKWAEDYSNFDLFGLLSQIGAIPAPASK
jgi:steroid delta-isomerase-like uncharacterized protein